MKIHLVGGFLGSGKTTAIVAAARRLVDEGKKVGIITNDQGKYLVDSQFFRLEDFPAVEVTGGCFCCNYGNFSESINSLANEINPDYIFAESVGSCTDLVATVIQPLLDLKTSSTREVTFSVMSDSRLLFKFLSGEELPFQEGILYIFNKQIEEAGVLVVNKSDLLTEKNMGKLQKLVKEKYPDKVIVSQNSLADGGIEDWFYVLESGLILPGSQLDLDYQIYGAGEQSLAWFDGYYRIEFETGNIDHWLKARISALLFKLKEKRIGLGHLKFLISDRNHHVKLSVVSLQDEVEEIKTDGNWISPLTFTVNARLECSAEQIITMFKKIFFEQLINEKIRIDIVNEQAFHPGFPTPTHRSPR
jgi:Ni2+-binding GTPase involved in maturation of urease and hydrogenase